MKRIKYVILGCVAGLLAACGGVAIADDTGDNDVIVPQRVFTEFFTRDNGSSEKNFKFSVSAPVEIRPGRWCQFLSADAHSATEGNNGNAECFNANDGDPALKSFLDERGFSIEHQDRQTNR